MKTFYFSLVLLTFSFLLFTSRVSAQVRYPIKELNNCRDAKECYLYCEIPTNKATCWSYGKYDLNPEILGESTESDVETVQKHGITFPIKDLGNCANINQCRTYCNKEENRNMCMDFARKRGLARVEKVEARHQAMLERAKTELGCSNKDECRNFCENPQNQQRCMSFADKHAPAEYRKQKDEMMRKAKESLGCDSFESCKNFCEQPTNQERCMKFAENQMPPEFKERYESHKKEMVEKMKQYNLPCDSMETCRDFCEKPENKEKCTMVAEPGNVRIEIKHEEGFTCNTEEECRKYCEQNTEKCPGFQETQEKMKKFEEEEERRQQEFEGKRSEFEERELEDDERSGDYMQFPQTYPTVYQQNYPTEMPQSNYPTYSPEHLQPSYVPLPNDQQ